MLGSRSRLRLRLGLGFGAVLRRLLARNQGQFQGIAGELVGLAVERAAEDDDVAVELDESRCRRLGGTDRDRICGLGMSTRIFESHRTSSGVGSSAAVGDAFF